MENKLLVLIQFYTVSQKKLDPSSRT